LSGFDFFSVPFFDYLAERDKIFDTHFVQFLFYHPLFTVRNGYVPVICMVVHQVRSGQMWGIMVFISICHDQNY